MQADGEKNYGVGILIVCLIGGALHLAYGLAGGPSRPGSALQGIGLCLLGMSALFSGSAGTRRKLAALGRGSLSGILLVLGGLALTCGIVLSWK